MLKTQSSIYQTSFIQKDILSKHKSFRELGQDHPAVKSMGNRLLPQNRFNDIYLVHKFFTWTNELIPNKFKDLTNDHPRMVIPFRDADGKVFAYQGRSFGEEQPKYITIVLDQNNQKIFGLDRVDDSRNIIIVEKALLIVFFFRIVLQSLKVIYGYLNTKLKALWCLIMNLEIGKSSKT